MTTKSQSKAVAFAAAFLAVIPEGNLLLHQTFRISPFTKSTTQYD